ncbi:MAG TPA: WhiB family transcriptional regulator [Acidimicrobiales bacterium]|nr:WhiB family transcriptional regulator [Acidimicrobiales bacterium]
MFADSWAEGDYELEQVATVIWQDAACQDGSGSLTALFFSDEVPHIELAKAICSTCSLVEPCLQGALARREPAGVWGGQLFADGQVIAFKRKRGRPPKAAAAAAAPLQTCPQATLPADVKRHDDNDNKLRAATGAARRGDSPAPRAQARDFVEQRLKTA